MKPFIDLGAVASIGPGEVYFGSGPGPVRTLLGSCVAITMWHPQRRLGGMCHFLVPERRGRRCDALDGRYGKEAILLLLRHAVAADTHPGHYRFKVFGGGHMFPGAAGTGPKDVGALNVECALQVLNGIGHEVAACHVGDSGHRTVVFDPSSGDVWLQHRRLAR